jgi:hypothetical protein
MIKSIYPFEENFEKVLQDRNDNVHWITYFLEHVSQLDAIQHLVKLIGAWDNNRFDTNRINTFFISLIYIGKARSEEAARIDLGDIMLATKSLFEDCAPTVACNALQFELNKEETANFCNIQHNYHGRYVGKGKFGDVETKWTLYVPWLPSNDCEFKETEHTTKIWNLTCQK